MTRQPIVYVYNKDGSLLYVPGAGSNINWLKSFRFKLNLTKGDSLTLTYAFNRMGIDLEFAKAGRDLEVQWGYVGGPFSDRFKVRVKTVEFTYSKGGLIVTLKCIARSAAIAEGTVPSDDPFEDDAKVGKGVITVEVKGDEQGELYKASYEISPDKDPRETEIVIDAIHKTREGKTMARYVVDDAIKQKREEDLAANKEEKVWDEAYEKQFLKHKYNSGKYKGYVSPLDQFRMSAAERSLYHQYHDFTNQWVQGSDLVAVDQMIDKFTEKNIVTNYRGDKVKKEEIDWSSSPIFIISTGGVGGIQSGANLITFTVTKGDKDERYIKSKVTVVDPTTGTVKTSSTEVANGFNFTLMDSRGNKVAVKYWRDEKNGYLQKEGGAVVKLDLKTYEKRRELYIKTRELSKVTGMSQDELLSLDAQGKLDIDKALAERQQIIDRETLKRLEANGILYEDIEDGYVTVKYNGRTIEDAKNENRKRVLDSIYYNTKLNLKIEGMPQAIDNTNFVFLCGNSQLDGTYHIDSCEHSITKGGYVTTIIAYRVVENYDMLIAELDKQFEEDNDVVTYREWVEPVLARFISVEHRHMIFQNRKYLESRDRVETPLSYPVWEKDDWVEKPMGLNKVEFFTSPMGPNQDFSTLGPTRPLQQRPLTLTDAEKDILQVEHPGDRTYDNTMEKAQKELEKLEDVTILEKLPITGDGQ